MNIRARHAGHSHESGHRFWGTRILDPFLVHSLEPEILGQVLHRSRMFSVERVEYEDVGMISGRAIRLTVW